MAEDIKILRSEAEYQVLNLVYKAYAKIQKKPDEYGLTAGDIYNDNLVAKALVDNAEKLGVKGLKPEHVKMAMDAASTFAGEVTSGSEALAKVANDTIVNGEFRTSEASFYDRLAAEGKTILDSKQDYADIMKVANAYKEIMKNPTLYDITKDSTVEDWKKAIASQVLMNEDEIEKALVNAGKVVGKEKGMNAIASIAENNKPLINSYKKFDARNQAELASLDSKDKGSKKAWLDSRKANRKAKRTVFGSALGKALMFLAVPGALVGLFFGAAAVAGGIAALSAVANLGIVLGTGLIGYIGYHVFKRPFQRLWDRLTKNQDKALALLASDENVVGSSKHRAKTKEMYKGSHLANDMANIKNAGMAPEDEKLINDLMSGETLDISGLEVEDGLSAEHFERPNPENTSVAGEEREKEVGGSEASAPEPAPKPAPSPDENRNTHSAVVNATVDAFNNLTEEEGDKFVAESVKEYTNQIVEEYQSANPGVTISENERKKIEVKVAEVYGEYLSYRDTVATSKIRRLKTKEAEIDKLQDTPFVVTIKKADGSLDSVTLNLSGKDIANVVNVSVKDTAEKNAAERAIRTKMQESYAKATAGSDVAHDIVDQELLKIAAERGIDYNSLKNYFESKLADDKKYVHAGVKKLVEGELSNEELETLAKDIAGLEKVGAEANEKWAEIQKERQFIRTTAIDKKYAHLVTDELVKKAIDAYVEANYVGKDAKEKAKLAADLKAYYVEDKPFIDGKLEIPSLKDIAGGKVGKYGDKKDIDKDAVYVKAGINSTLQAIIKDAAKQVDNMQSDRAKYNELQKFQKECDKVGLGAPKGIVAQFIDHLKYVELQKALGEEKLAKLREIVKNNPDIAQKLDAYIKAVPDSEKAGTKATGRIVGGEEFHHEDETFVLDLCHSVYMPYKEAAKKAIEEQRAEKQRLEQERLAAEQARRQAEKERAKKDKELAKRLKRGVHTNITTVPVVHETPHETTIGTDGTEMGGE